MFFFGNINLATADITDDTEMLLNWAENSYPGLFPTHQKTQSIEPWLFRFYPGTNIYAGVNTDDIGVYVLGEPWGNENPTFIDTLPDLLSTAQEGKLTGVTAIATELYYSLVLKNDGTVWAWGSGFAGKLGDVAISASIIPIQVAELTDV